MTKEQAMSEIKALRNKIEDQGIDGMNDPKVDAFWVNQVVYFLDAASDVIEFPKGDARSVVTQHELLD